MPAWLARVRWHLRRVPWPTLAMAAAGAILLLAAGIAQVRVLEPLAVEAAGIRDETQVLRRRAEQRQAAVQVRGDPAELLVQFYRFFPPEGSVPEALERIYAAAAANNLALERGDYRLAPEADVRLQRYDVALPVRGRYSAVRRFVAQILKENPNLALTGITFARQASIDVGVDVQLQLTLFLAGAP